jgi:L-ascorbate metabolism protein UlaG (beta-lactamase superfamily)
MESDGSETGNNNGSPTAARTAHVLYVGHATVLVEMDGVRLLTDPLVRLRIAHLRRVAEVDLRVLGGIDAVLISHLHLDHLDIPSLRRIDGGPPIVAPQGAGRLLKRKGFGSVHELAVGERLRVGELTVRATPAVHDRRRRPFGVRAEPIGYVIEGSRSLYFAGDTDLFDEMGELGPVDVALVPIWGWGPSLGVGHLDPRRAAEAARRLRASITIPIHWGTYFPLHTAFLHARTFLHAPADEFRSHMREIAPEVEVRILRPGEETLV